MIIFGKREHSFWLHLSYSLHFRQLNSFSCKWTATFTSVYAAGQNVFAVRQQTCNSIQISLSLTTITGNKKGYDKEQTTKCTIQTKINSKILFLVGAHNRTCARTHKNFLLKENQSKTKTKTRKYEQYEISSSWIWSLVAYAVSVWVIQRLLLFCRVCTRERKKTRIEWKQANNHVYGPSKTTWDKIICNAIMRWNSPTTAATATKIEEKNQVIARHDSDFQCARVREPKWSQALCAMIETTNASSYIEHNANLI